MGKVIISLIMLGSIFFSKDLTLNELDSFFYAPEENLIEIKCDTEHILDNSKNRVNELLNELPSELKKGIEEIILYSYDNDNIVGTTKDGVIKLYNFSKYSKSTQKYILYHEVAHTFGRYLMDKKILDYHYTDYQEYVKLDKNYVSKYSKEYIINKNNYSEDFADSVVEYLLNNEKFISNHPNRSTYIYNVFQIIGVDIYI